MYLNVIYRRYGGKMKITNLVDLSVGVPASRIQMAESRSAPVYKIYGQDELEADLEGVESNGSPKTIRTIKQVMQLKTGDIVFSLVSGKASLVSQTHAGYLYTQNYVVLTPSKKIDSTYLVYLLNEDPDIQKQFWRGLQGSQVMKYTVTLLRELKIKKLPPVDKQQAIGQIYINQLRIQALKERIARNEMILRRGQLREINLKWKN